MLRVAFLAAAILLALWQARNFTSRMESSPGDALADPADKATTKDEGGHAESLRLATWNLKRLGHGDKELAKVAEIIAELDVVAIQEVMDKDGVDKLLAHLPGWRAEVSKRAVGRGRYVEWYAVLYRAKKVAVERSFLVADRRDAFAREPFVVCMRSGEFDFCLVSIHVIFGRKARARDAEIDALGKLVTGLRDSGSEKDWILVGDFNRAPRAPGWDRLHDAGFAFTTTKRIATSLGKRAYRNAYDHILADASNTGELEGRARRIDFVSRLCDGDFADCSASVSDHAPLMVEFRRSGPDDD